MADVEEYTSGQRPGSGAFRRGGTHRRQSVHQVFGILNTELVA
jgi:hypothetical protein